MAGVPRCLSLERYAIWAQQKHVSTPTVFPVFEKFRPRRNEISWKVLVAYYFITGYRFKVQKGSNFYPMFDVSDLNPEESELSWLFLHPDTRQWYEGSGGLAQPSPPRCVGTEVPAIPASVAANLLSLDLLAWIRGAPAAHSCRITSGLATGVAGSGKKNEWWAAVLCKAQQDLREHRKEKHRWTEHSQKPARSCPKASKSWATGRVKKSKAQELRMPHKGRPFHLCPLLFSSSCAHL